jgi:hypothetical protein
MRSTEAHRSFCIVGYLLRWIQYDGMTEVADGRLHYNKADTGCGGPGLPLQYSEVGLIRKRVVVPGPATRHTQCAIVARNDDTFVQITAEGRREITRRPGRVYINRMLIRECRVSVDRDRARFNYSNAPHTSGYAENFVVVAAFVLGYLDIASATTRGSAIDGQVNCHTSSSHHASSSS